MHGRHYCSLLVLALLTGCEETAPAPQPTPAPLPEVGRDFDTQSTGTIAGRVVWRGTRTVVPPFRSIENPLTDQAPPPARDWPNPNAPVLTDDGGVTTSIVFLRGVDPARAKPWHHPPVRVELAAHQFAVVPDKVGFVRAGDAVEFVSRQPVFHTVQARGDAFFSLALPEPDQPRRRVLSTPGLVELSSGAGLYWMRAYLFVDHHPYFARVDARGHFHLDDVPEGDYDLVAWHPNWRVTREERNPDSFRVQQVRFAAPLSLVRRVHVERGQTITLDLDLSGLLR